MPSRNPKYHSSELIKGILREIQQILDNNPQHGWMNRLSEKHGIPATTIGGWWKRYGSPDKVPERPEKFRTPKKSAVKQTLYNSANGSRPGQPKEFEPGPQQSTNGCDTCRILRETINSLKLIIADAYIESVRRTQ